VKTVSYGQQIKRFDLEPEIDDEGRVQYQISGLSLHELIGRDLDDINEMLCDNSVVNGHLLEDMSYRFVAFDPADNTVTIEVDADAEGWRRDK
jgi:hypothetical protein